MANTNDASQPPGEPADDLSYLDPLVRQGALAFERELPRLQQELFAQGCSEKEWVAFHGDKYLGHARRRYELLQKWCGEGGIPQEEVYCHTLMPPFRRVLCLHVDTPER